MLHCGMENLLPMEGRKYIANNNPIINTRTYFIQLDDGKVTELAANLIAAQMYAQCDPDGNMYVMLGDLTYHRKSIKALYIEDQKATSSHGRNLMRCSTVGWKICCQWKDGSIYWEKKLTLKNPTQQKLQSMHTRVVLLTDLHLINGPHMC